jgi:hypothetical protein
MLRAIVLAVALLAAQHNALAHAVWHASAAGSQSQDQDQDQSKLCDLHSALGSVLGVLDGAAGDLGRNRVLRRARPAGAAFLRLLSPLARSARTPLKSNPSAV